MRPTSRPPSTARRVLTTAVAGLVLAAGAAGCSSGDDSGGSSSADGASADLAAPETLVEEGADGPPAAARADSATGAGTTDVATAVSAAIADRKLARRASVELEVTDIVRAAARLRSVAAAADGLVVAEQVSSDPGSPGTPGDSGDGETVTAPSGWGTVTISVPTEKLDSTLDQVAELGTVRSRSTSTDDVTGQYVDTASRVKSAQASVERVRALMSRATKIADVVSLEAELSRRQADLEAMQQQLASLDDRVALSPITVQLSTTGALPPESGDPTGFIAGLASGWAAFTTSIRLVLTLVGALLPFAVAGALVVVPLLVWWRRRPRTVPVGAPSTPSSPSA